MNSQKTDARTVLTAILVSLLLAACGDKPQAMLVSAKNYLAKNDTKSAVIQIKNALQSDPNLPEARFLLGTALLESGDPVGAETELRKARELKHPQDLVIPPLARSLLAQGQAKKVTDEFANIELSQPHDDAFVCLCHAGQGGTFTGGLKRGPAGGTRLRAGPDCAGSTKGGAG
jgi:Flp pilus assembly protein TadD